MDYDINFSLSIPANDLAIQTNVDDLVCIICMNICFKPVLITCCERLMCLHCIKMMLKLSPLIKCPHCNNVNLNFIKPSRIINRMYENLTFICPNKDQGCNEKIKYHFYPEHIYNTCKFNNNSIYQFCKNCVEIYPSDSIPEHTCNNNKGDNLNISFLEKTLNSLYDNTTQNNQDKIEKSNSNKNSSSNVKCILNHNCNTYNITHTHGAITIPK